MIDDINLYTVRLKKIKRLIDITIYKHSSVVDFCYASFDQYINMYYLSESAVKFTTEVLLYYNIIEKNNFEEIPFEFVLTQTALISLL